MSCVVCDKPVDQGVCAGEHKRIQFHYACLAFCLDGMLDDARTRKALRTAVRYGRDHIPWNDAETWEADAEKGEFLVS